jgi:hypothetical protein
MNQTAEEKGRVRQKLAKDAIEAAMQSRWQDAIDLNRSIIGQFPEEADAHNRLGKALTETGKIKEAREAYQRALQIEPSNSIAKKNLDRLQLMRGSAEPDKAQQVDTSLFIEEMGKTGVTTLKPQNMKTLATLSAGDEVTLVPVGSRLTVETASGEYMADVEPRLALRLSKLIAGGNKYAAAVAGLRDDSVRVIIKETFQDPSQIGRLSFPAGKAGDVVRPYIKESMIRADSDEDEEDAFDEVEDWEEPEADAEAEATEESLFDAAAAEDTSDDDFDE